MFVVMLHNTSAQIIIILINDEDEQIQEKHSQRSGCSNKQSIPLFSKHVPVLAVEQVQRRI